MTAPERETLALVLSHQAEMLDNQHRLAGRIDEVYDRVGLATPRSEHDRCMAETWDAIERLKELIITTRDVLAAEIQALRETRAERLGAQRQQGVIVAYIIAAAGLTISLVSLITR